MKLAVIGPGAMGLLFGARLAQQGHEVYMVGTNPATLEKLEREGQREAANLLRIQLDHILPAPWEDERTAQEKSATP